jgi:hydrogenase expression/formation protein HypC
MCMAVPSRVIALTGDMATVVAFGAQRDVSLLLMHETIEIGDYLLVQAGGFAYERIERMAALDTLHLLDELCNSLVEN